MVQIESKFSSYPNFYSTYFKLHDLRDDPNDANYMLNNRTWPAGKINVMLALIDIPNHRQPEYFNRTDFTSFNLLYEAPRYESDYYGTIGLRTNSSLYKVGQEYNYVYNPQIEPMELLKHYGFAIDNNMFSAVILRTNNYFKDMNDKQVSVC